MSDMQVGEYCRTKEGYIAKVIEIDDITYMFDKTIRISCGDVFLHIFLGEEKQYITKHSPNIIDLIEVGDYINGCLIVEISKDPFIKGQTNLWTNMLFSEGEPFPNEYYKVKILEKDIKSIVTHEQFRDVRYIVNE